MKTIPNNLNKKPVMANKYGVEFELYRIASNLEDITSMINTQLVALAQTEEVVDESWREERLTKLRAAKKAINEIVSDIF